MMPRTAVAGFGMCAAIAAWAVLWIKAYSSRRAFQLPISRMPLRLDRAAGRTGRRQRSELPREEDRELAREVTPEAKAVTADGLPACGS
jgi:hypothetical protein